MISMFSFNRLANLRYSLHNESGQSSINNKKLSKQVIILHDGHQPSKLAVLILHSLGQGQSQRFILPLYHYWQALNLIESIGRRMFLTYIYCIFCFVFSFCILNLLHNRGKEIVKERMMTMTIRYNKRVNREIIEIFYSLLSCCL